MLLLKIKAFAIEKLHVETLDFSDELLKFLHIKYSITATCATEMLCFIRGEDEMTLSSKCKASMQNLA